MIRFLSSMALLALMLGLTPAIAASDAASGPITVQDAWATPSTRGDPSSDVYLTIKNTGDRPDQLLEAKTAVAEDALVDVSIIDANDFPRMSVMQPLLVPATSETVLQPGAIHVALINLDHELAPGQSFPMQLVFAHAGTITVQVRVGGSEGSASAGTSPPAKG